MAGTPGSLEDGRAEWRAWRQDGTVWIVAVRASHHHAPALPPVEPLAMPAAGPRVSLGKVALCTEAVSVVQRRALAALECEQFDVVGSMARRARCARLRRMHRLDV